MKNLDDFYGVEATQIEIEQTIGAASTEFDAGELADVVYSQFDAIADAIANGDTVAIGLMVIEARKQRIADIASQALYGKVGVIQAHNVKV